MALRRNRIEDLTNRVTRNVWGTQVSYTPKDGAAVTTAADGGALVGVFDSAHLVTVQTDGGPVSDRAPMLELVLDDIDGLFEPRPGDKFTLLGPADAPHVGTTYTVHDVQYDSAQAAMLICTEGDHSA